MTKDEILDYLSKRTEYTVKSLMRDLLFEVYGEIKMSVNIGAVSYYDVKELEAKLIRGAINNPKIMHKLT